MSASGYPEIKKKKFGPIAGSNGGGVWWMEETNIKYKRVGIAR